VAKNPVDLWGSLKQLPQKDWEWNEDGSASSVDELGARRSGAIGAQWLFEHGVIPFYTPLSGSRLNMTESIQRVWSTARWLVRHRPSRPNSSAGWKRRLVPGMPIPRRSNGLANTKRVATERIDDVIHSVAPERTRVSPSVAAFSL
jgi:hypothetical protein